MTNNPTIDGVSRELLERVCGIRQKSYDIEDSMQAGAELRSFLALTASDEPVEIVPSDNADQAFTLMDFALSFALCNTDHGGTRRDVKKAQEHLSALKDHTAALQSTIAQLQERIAELESGPGEPVGRVSYIGSGFVRVRTTECLAMEQPLFTAPPAPVSVVDEQQAFANWTHEVVEFEHSNITRKIQRRDLMDVKDEKNAWEGWMARACLDATAALNEDRR